MSSGGESRYTSGVYRQSTVSAKKVKEGANEAATGEVATAAPVLHDKSEWSHAELEKLFQRCAPNLWMYLYIPFLVSFFVVWVMSQHMYTIFAVDFISDESHQRSVTMGRSKAIYIVAAANFAIGTFVQLSGMAFQISLKKRILNRCPPPPRQPPPSAAPPSSVSDTPLTPRPRPPTRSFVAYISMVACSVYLAKASALFPDFRALDRQPTQFLRRAPALRTPRTQFLRMAGARMLLSRTHFCCRTCHASLPAQAALSPLQHAPGSACLARGSLAAAWGAGSFLHAPRSRSFSVGDRYYAWANTTPMMLTTVAALGGSMQVRPFKNSDGDVVYH